MLVVHTIPNRVSRIVWSLVLKLCRNLRRIKGKTLSRACVHSSPTIGITVLFAFALLLRYISGHPNYQELNATMAPPPSKLQAIAANHRTNRKSVPLQATATLSQQQELTKRKENDRNKEEKRNTADHHDEIKDKTATTDAPATAVPTKDPALWTTNLAHSSPALQESTS